MGTQNPQAPEKATDKKVTDKAVLKNVLKGVRVILGIIGVLSVIVAIVSIAGKMTDLLLLLNIRVKYGRTQEFYTTLTSALLAVISLFFAFTPAIDRFFNIIERKEIRLSEEKEGISLEFIFFFSIAIVLTVIGIMLGLGELVVEAELPLLGRFTEPFIVGSIIILAIVSLAVAFNETIKASWKEMKRVTWPKAKEMTEYAAQVFAFVIFLSLLFYVFDMVIELGLEGLRNLLA